MRLSFLGAAGQVTGSCYLVESGDLRFLVDVGLNQGTDDRGDINRRPCPCRPADLDLVVLTHAHLDHCGLLPRLYAQGFNGPVYCTPGTADLTAVVLRDSAQIQEEDAAFEQRRYRRRGGAGEPPGPLYTVAEAEACLRLLVPVEYDQDTELPKGLHVRFRDAGHILGAASLELTVPEGGGRRRWVFSGDLGRPDRPILRDPVLPEPGDVVVMESTYGNRDHEPWDKTLADFKHAILQALARHGHVLIPAFAIGRTQDVLWVLSQMVRAGELPPVPVVVDSPMAVSVTEIMQRHAAYFDEETRSMLASGRSPFDFPHLQYVRSMAQSSALNFRPDPFIVVAGSGMCSGGRIRHHLRHHLEHRNDEILLVGYQAEKTTGREIQEGRSPLQLFGEQYDLRAHVTYTEGFSAHAGRAGLLQWARQVGAKAERFFLTHGEEEALGALAETLKTELPGELVVPGPGESQEF